MIGPTSVGRSGARPVVRPKSRIPISSIGFVP